MKLIAAILLSLSFPVFAQTPAPAPKPAPAPAKAVSLKAQLSKTPLSGVIIPQVTFDQASVEDAIGALTTMVETESKGAIKLQWIDKAFDRKTWPTKVTISAKGFPAGKLMSEILEQVGLEAKLEEHAIVLSPKTRVVERRVVKEGKPVDGKVESGPERSGFPKNPLVK
ncbi:MAG: hypothetical protein EOP83_35485 [Verrucomicrobiaceae bacterium]|nr:MAG: hypothetical protein EOP83_35485 [Verrucomicrobiaceae bacterium]